MGQRLGHSWQCSRFNTIKTRLESSRKNSMKKIVYSLLNVNKRLKYFKKGRECPLKKNFQNRFITIYLLYVFTKALVVTLFILTTSALIGYPYTNLKRFGAISRHFCRYNSWRASSEPLPATTPYRCPSRCRSGRSRRTSWSSRLETLTCSWC